MSRFELALAFPVLKKSKDFLKNCIINMPVLFISGNHVISTFSFYCVGSSRQETKNSEFNQQ